jgi:hypothetical protein
MEQWWNDGWQGKLDVCKENAVTLSTTWTALALNLSVHVGKLTIVIWPPLSVIQDCLLKRLTENVLGCVRTSSAHFLKKLKITSSETINNNRTYKCKMTEFNKVVNCKFSGVHIGCWSDDGHLCFCTMWWLNVLMFWRNVIPPPSGWLNWFKCMWSKTEETDKSVTNDGLREFEESELWKAERGDSIVLSQWQLNFWRMVLYNRLSPVEDVTIIQMVVWSLLGNNVKTFNPFVA